MTMFKQVKVFPTHVGVFPSSQRSSGLGNSLPHARGGVSLRRCNRRRSAASSPRTWGCFLCGSAEFEGAGVFPTHVGVFPPRTCQVLVMWCLPHARGGVSAAAVDVGDVVTSSPRTWGCFCNPPLQTRHFRVFPTHVGVFLSSSGTGMAWACLPHARGGVSANRPAAAPPTRSSPRTWGCFHHAQRTHSIARVFPTHVGVFLRLWFLPVFPSSLPHARGGVSAQHHHRCTGLRSSPRTWGCFWLPPSRGGWWAVFPTHVGVFLSLSWTRWR